MNAVQNDLAGDVDAFVTKLDNNLANIEFSTYYGTDTTDQGLGVDIYSIMDYTDDSPVVVGYTIGNNLPGRNQYYSIQYDFGGEVDAFIVIFYGGGGSYAKPVIEEEPVEIRDEFGKLLIYPNPVQERVTIFYEFEGEEDVFVQVCNILGEVLDSFEVVNAKGNVLGTVDVSHFNRGIYFVKIVHNGNAKCFRFSKF